MNGLGSMNDDPIMRTVTMNKLLLDRIKFNSETRVSKYAVNGICMEDEVTYQLISYIAGLEKRREYSTSFEFPKNWWEHIKQNLMPKWYIKIFPVKMEKATKTTVFDHKAIFPEIDISLLGKYEIVYLAEENEL